MNEINWAEMLAAAGMDPNTQPPEWMNQPEPKPEFYRYTIAVFYNEPTKPMKYIKCKTLHECIMQIAANCTEYDRYIVEAHDADGYYKIIEHDFDDEENKFYDRTQGRNGEFNSIWFNSYTYKKRKNMEED